MKKYKLLKDYRTPKLSISMGSIVGLGHNNEYVVSICSLADANENGSINRDVVENNPTWFEEIKEQDIYTRITKEICWFESSPGKLAQFLREKYVISERWPEKI